jgi:hypothetical protein
LLEQLTLTVEDLEPESSALPYSTLGIPNRKGKEGENGGLGKMRIGRRRGAKEKQKPNQKYKM